jgi:hypothetical protein
MDKVYALLMNFLLALYEFSNVMDFDHKGKGGPVTCLFSRIERTSIA